MRDIREPIPPRVARSAWVALVAGFAFELGGKAGGPIGWKLIGGFALLVFVVDLLVDGGLYGYAMARYWSDKQRETEARLRAERAL